MYPSNYKKTSRHLTDEPYQMTDRDEEFFAVTLDALEWDGTPSETDLQAPWAELEVRDLTTGQPVTGVATVAGHEERTVYVKVVGSTLTVGQFVEVGILLVRDDGVGGDPRKRESLLAVECIA